MVLINSNSTVLGIGNQMPSFSLPSVDGSVINSHNIRNAVLVVVFTCNHCPYAQAYEDRLVMLARQYADQDVQFVLINSNDASDYPEDSFEKMKERATEKQFPFPYCLDESQDVAKAFGALCTPHCFVFDALRVLRYKGRVDDNWEDASRAEKHELKEALEALTDGRFPDIAEANAIGCSIKWKSGNEPTLGV